LEANFYQTCRIATVSTKKVEKKARMFFCYLATPPSSQVSPAAHWMIPSPHFRHLLGSPIQVQPASSVQVAEQPSPAVFLPRIMRIFKEFSFTIVACFACLDDKVSTAETYAWGAVTSPKNALPIIQTNSYHEVSLAQIEVHPSPLIVFPIFS
jgi:hypothetical protein